MVKAVTESHVHSIDELFVRGSLVVKFFDTNDFDIETFAMPQPVLCQRAT